MKSKLNIGCGFKKNDDHHNVDITELVHPDEVVDLEQLPWPWPDNSFDTITAKDTLEHLGASPREFIKILQEMYRVSKDQAEWVITVPHWRCDLAVDDPTHVRVITANTFKLFDQKLNKEFYERGLSHSMLGLTSEIDVETEKVSFDFINYWKNQVDSGMLGSAEFEIKLNTLNNICETTHINIRVHKPGRYLEWAKKFI